MQVDGRVLRAPARLGTPQHCHVAPEKHTCKAVSCAGKLRSKGRERLQAQGMEARAFLLNECWEALEGWEFGLQRSPHHPFSHLGRRETPKA